MASGSEGTADRRPSAPALRPRGAENAPSGRKGSGMRKLGIAGLFVGAALALAGVAYTAPSENDDELLKDEGHFLEQMNKTFSGGTKAAQMRNMEVVGQADLALLGARRHADPRLGPTGKRSDTRVPESGRIRGYPPAFTKTFGRSGPASLPGIAGIPASMTPGKP